MKDPRHIAHATAVGLDDFTFDNASEITQIARHAPGANVHLRLLVSNQGSLAHLSKKFGAEPADAVPLLLAARDQGLHPRGVSFHVGSQCLDARRYVEAFEAARGVFDEAAGQGLDLETGGFAPDHDGPPPQGGGAVGAACPIPRAAEDLVQEP